MTSAAVVFWCACVGPFLPDLRNSIECCTTRTPDIHYVNGPASRLVLSLMADSIPVVARTDKAVSLRN